MSCSNRDIAPSRPNDPSSYRWITFGSVGTDMDSKESRMHVSNRLRVVFTLLAFGLLMGVAFTARVAAQDDTTATSPIVGVWVMPPMGENAGSVTTLSSDGIVIDSETDGPWGIGAWEATGPDTGVMTFVFQISEPDAEFTGSIIIRASLTYDAATDTLAARYTVTGAASDGAIVFTDETPVDVTFTRFPAQGHEHVGEPIDGLISAEAATPVS